MPISRTQFLVTARIEAPTLEVWLEQGWILPRRTATDVIFSDMDLARAQLIRELQHDFGANDAGIDIILHLLDQMHSMRSALGQLRDESRHAGVEQARDALPPRPGRTRARRDRKE